MSTISVIEPVAGKPFVLILLEIMVPFIQTITEQIPVWASIPLFFLSICATFVWNYLDIFITMISMGLSTLFKQLNSELEQAKDEVAS